MSYLIDHTIPNSFDVQGELQKLLGLEPYVINLPKTIEGVTSVLYQYRVNPVQRMAVRLRRTPSDPVTELQYKQLAAFLAAMCNLEMIDPRMK
jgi:hypothetical protein